MLSVVVYATITITVMVSFLLSVLYSPEQRFLSTVGLPPYYTVLQTHINTVIDTHNIFPS